MTSLALLGSGEFLPWCRSVDAWCFERARIDGSRVLVVPTASAPEGEEPFARWARMGLEHYAAMGYAPEILPVRSREDALDPTLAAAVEGARLIFFSGGNPGYLAETLRDTPVWRAVLEAAGRGAGVGGCSAGAVFLGTKAPYVAGDTLDRWVPGLSFVRDAYVAPHFDALDTYGTGLREMVIGERPAGSTLVGIDEETALYGDGERWTVAGSGAVWVLRDGDRDLTEHRSGAEVHLPLGLALPKM